MIAITIIQLIACLVMIGIVLLQSGKRSGLSGAIAGNADTYMDKAGNSWDKMLARWTKWIALAWAVLGLALNLV